MADRNKPGYMNFADIADRLESGKLNAYDTVYTKDTHEVVFIKEDKSLIRMKCRLDVYPSVVVAEYNLNLNTDTYVGQIVGIEDGEWVRLYNVNYADDKFIVKQVGINEYGQLVNKPQINGVTLEGNKTTAQLGIDIPTKFSQLYDDIGYETIDHLVANYYSKTETYSKTEADNLFATQSSVPTDLADLQDDSTHRLVTDADKERWNNPAENVQADWNTTDPTDGSYIKNKPSLFSGNYNDLTNKPDIPDDLADLNDDSTHRLVTDVEKTAWNGKSDFSGSYADLTNKPNLADLQSDSGHRTVSDSEKSTWNGKSNFSGSYNDLTDKPSIPDELTDLDDISISNIQNGQILKYNSTTQKFENANESGGTVSDAYKKIKIASTEITASGEDVLELVAGTNVTLVPDTVNKKVTINSSGGGGGTSTGDMLKEIYDTNNDGIVNASDEATTLTGLTATVSELNTLGGIESNVQDQLDAKADVSNVPSALSDLSDDSTHRLVTDTEKSTWDAKSDFSGSYTDLTNKPSIPDDLADLSDDSTHRLVTDTEKANWNAKSDFSGSYTDLTNKPTIPDAQVQADWNESDNSKVDYIKNKPTIPDAQIQSDWNQSDNTKKDYIKNKPTIPTALSDLSDDSTHRTVTDTEKTAWSAGEANVQSNWNETDTDSDAYIQNKPTIPSVVANPGNTTASLTSIGIDGTNYAIQGGSGGGAVDSVNGKTGVVVLDAEDVGALPDDTALFSGDYEDLTNKPTIPDDLADLNDDSTHRLVTDTEKTTWNGKSDFSGSYNDLSDKPTIPDAQVQSDWNQSDNTKVDFIKNKPTLGTASAKDYVNSVVDGSSDLVTSDAVHDYVDSAISGVYKPSGNKTCAELLPALLIVSNLGNVYNMTDSGVTTSDFVEGAGKTIEIGDNVVIVDVGTQNNASYKFDLLSGMVDLSNYIQKSSTSGLMKNDGSVDTNSYATTSQIPDITGKADKVTSATSGNFAGLDANGNLVDSGHKHSDYLTQHQDISGKADKVTSPTNGNIAGLNASGNLTDSGISGDMTTTSASGNPISIANLKSAQIAKNPIITFEPIQAGSGTPSPSNVRAISGYDKIEVLSCGKNLCNGNFVQRAFSDGVPEASTWRLASNDFIRVKPSTQYTFSVTGSNLKIAFLWFITNAYGSPSYISADGYVSGNNRTITTPANANYCIIGVAFNDDSTITPSQISNTQLEESASATTYEPYHKTTDLSESLGQTVYYGELDVRTGKFKVTHGEKDMGDLAYSYNSTYERYSSSVSDMTASIASLNWLCECYETSGKAYIDSDRTDAQISARNSNIYIRDSRYTDEASLKTALTGTKLIYPLTTPFYIQLTPHEIALSSGYNYVSTNGSQIQLAYHNGELATHADVEQLSETVNLISDNFLSWKPLAFKNGSVDITLPSKYNEICAIIDYNDNMFIFNIPKIYLTDSEKRFRNGAYLTSTTKYGASLIATKSIIKIGNVYANDTDVTSSADIYIYYR